MTINKLVLGFVTLILGVALLSQVATIAQGSITTRQTQVNDSINIGVAKLGGINGTVNSTYPFAVSNLPAGWKSTDCPLAGITIENSSGEPFTVTTDYTLGTSTGTLLFVNNSKTFNETADNLTYVTYTYCADDYVNLGWGRTMINLVSGFFAIALLLSSIGIFYSLARESGILDV